MKGSTSHDVESSYMSPEHQLLITTISEVSSSSGGDENY